MSLYLGTITISSPVWVSSLSALGLTVAIATILLASNFTIIYAQLSLQQQGVQSNGGLTAALNGSSFTRGDTITVTGSVGERDPNSQVLIRVIDPQSKQVETGTAYITADNAFTYSFVAGEQKQFDSDDPMTTSGNYRMIVSYVTPGFDNEAVELVFAYNTVTQTEPSAAIVTTTTTTTQPSPIVNGVMTTFQSTDDSFKIQVPQGWLINDLDNTGLALSDEAMMGYGILAQLCPEKEEEQQQRLTQQSAMVLSNNNASDSKISNCQTSENDVIHIIRYHDLNSGRVLSNNFTANNNSGGRTTTADSVLLYHLQKLQELGYRDLQIVNITDTKVNLTNPQTNQTLTTVPAKLVEMTYTLASTLNQIRDGYFVLTSTDATTPYPGTTKGYVVFYEGNSSNNNNNNNNNTVASGVTRTTSTSSFGLAPTPLQPIIGQIFASFELILAPEVSQPLAPQTSGVGQTAVGQAGGGNGGDTSSCDSSYPDTCIPPPPPNLNCDDVSATNFRVEGSDPHGFDGDNDGIGCESGSGISGDSDDEDDDGADDTSCDSSYPDTCIPPPPPNLNCDDVSATNFRVEGSDPHGFDGDNDGIGCETSGGGGGGVDDNDDGGGDDDGAGDGGGGDDDGAGDGGGGDDDGAGDGGGGDDDGEENSADDCVVIGGRSTEVDGC